VLEYCEHHRGEPLPTTDETQDDNRKRSTDIGEWDQKFITVDQEMLFEIILAANYLDIKPLLCAPLVIARARGCPLTRHTQRRRMQDGREHDQGQDARGDPQALQHRQRLYARGGGTDQEGERACLPLLPAVQDCADDLPFQEWAEDR
jgi:hypothetical protein